MSTTRLRLGPLPKTETVKITITMAAALKDALDRYAAIHSNTWGDTVDAATLIPHMLEAFIARDRGYRKANTKIKPSDQQTRTVQEPDEGI